MQKLHKNGMFAQLSIVILTIICENYQISFASENIEYNQTTSSNLEYQTNEENDDQSSIKEITNAISSLSKNDFVDAISSKDNKITLQKESQNTENRQGSFLKLQNAISSFAIQTVIRSQLQIAIMLILLPFYYIEKKKNSKNDEKGNQTENKKDKD